MKVGKLIVVSLVIIGWLGLTVYTGYNVFTANESSLVDANCTILSTTINNLTGVYNVIYKVRVDIDIGDYYWKYIKNFTSFSAYSKSRLTKLKGPIGCTINKNNHNIIKFEPTTIYDDDDGIFIWLVALIILIVCSVGTLVIVILRYQDKKDDVIDFMEEKNFPWRD